MLAVAVFKDRLPAAVTLLVHPRLRAITDAKHGFYVGLDSAGCDISQPTGRGVFKLLSNVRLALNVLRRGMGQPASSDDIGEGIRMRMGRGGGEHTCHHNRYPVAASCEQTSSLGA